MSKNTEEKPLSFQEWIKKDRDRYIDDNFNIGRSICEADEFLRDSYNKKLAILRADHLLWDKHPETGEDYKYGTGWLYYPLPEGFEETVKSLINKLKS